MATFPAAGYPEIDGGKEHLDFLQEILLQCKPWQDETISYLDLSKKYGDVKAIRAIASANGENPLSIIIPCHRVIGTDGSLTGYAGGLARKKWLLQHEQDFSGSRQEKLF